MKRIKIFTLARLTEEGPSPILIQTGDGKIGIPLFQTKEMARDFGKREGVPSDTVIGRQRTARFFQVLRQAHIDGRLQYVLFNPEAGRSKEMSIPDFLILMESS
jgi:hypothetical protein